jgi:hypothetical protein
MMKEEEIIKADLDYHNYMSEEEYSVFEDYECDCESCISPYIRTESGSLIKKESNDMKYKFYSIVEDLGDGDTSVQFYKELRDYVIEMLDDMEECTDDYSTFTEEESLVKIEELDEDYYIKRIEVWEFNPEVGIPTCVDQLYCCQ